MPLYSWYVPLVLFGLAYAIFIGLVRFVPSNQGHARYASLDGLRGYLALAVFIHHAAIWNTYRATGQWKLMGSNLFNHLGTGAVSLFFMISAFLFYRQIHKSPDIDWSKLALSRFLRMVPLYAVAMAVLLGMVAYASDFRLSEEFSRIVPELVRWAIFTMFGAPDINAVHHTRYMMAGVVWSLPYEWAWYGVLPLIAWIIHRRLRWGPGAIGVIAAFYTIWRLEATLLLAFLGGIIAFWLNERADWRKFAQSRWGSVAGIAVIALTIGLFPSSHTPGALILYTVFFSLVVSGADLFGMLSNPISRGIGELSYGIYLFHGFVLYWVIGALPVDSAVMTTPSLYWLVIALLLPLLLVVCLCLHVFIEYPAMHARDAVYRHLFGPAKPRQI